MIMRTLVVSLILLVVPGCSSLPTKPQERTTTVANASRAELEDIRSDREAAENGASGTPIDSVDLGPGDALPSPVYTIAPDYSEELQSRGVRGRAVVGFYVERDGSVQTAYIVSQTNEQLGALAVTCVKKWKFTPGTRKGMVVRVRMQVPFEFSP